MIARLTSLLVWGLAAVAAVAWGLRVSGRPTPVPPNATLAATAMPTAGDYSRVLGSPPAVPVEAVAAPVTDSRYKLVGVVAQRRGQDAGVALISVDGKPARATRVGREVEPGMRLVSVGQRKVELGAQGQPVLALELPLLPEAQRGRPGEATQGALPSGLQAPQPTMPMSNARINLQPRPGMIDPASGRPIPLGGDAGNQRPDPQTGVVPIPPEGQSGVADYTPDNGMPQTR